MEAFTAAAKFWTLFYCSVVILNFTSTVQSRKDVVNQTVVYNCPQRCKCDEHLNMVNCTMKGLKAIPKDIPSDTLSLILDGNEFKYLRNDSFRNLRNLRNLSMRYCQISHVDRGVFAPLSKSLRMLWMSNNALDKRNGSFLVLLTNLELLDLSTSGWRFLQSKFKKLRKLKYFILADNSIEAIPTGKFPTSLEFLDLSKNLIKNVHDDPQFKREKNLKTLILSWNAIQIVKNKCFVRFKKLETVDMSYNILSDVERLAFQSDSLKVINLHKTNFQLDKDNWDIFQASPMIQKINMSFCRIDMGNLATSPFQGLNDLVELDLSGTGIASFSRVFFANHSKLTKLRLSSNPMSTLEGSDLKGVEDSLRELDVSSGRLSTISFESLPLKVWKNLKVVDFSDNPFLCDCNFIWLRHWLTRANASQVKVRGWNNYYCLTSKGQVNMFKLNRPSDTDCFQDPLFEDPCIVVVLLLTLLIWITATSASALHRFRWHLRYWYFMKTVNARKKTRRYLDGEVLDVFAIDVFIGYSSNDSYFVINELLPHLENDWNLRLCIHERDWIPGRDLTEHVLESIDNSRKTLLIVSNAFALSPWCHFELTMAQTRLMEEDRDSLVLILLEEIADCNLTPRLQIQMQRRTYIEWTKQSNVGQQLFWANLKHALAKPSDSLMNAAVSRELLE